MPEPGVLLIGTGNIADVHVQALRALGAPVVAVHDARPSIAEAFAVRHRIPAVAASLDRALLDPAVGVVHVLTPPGTHAELAARALAAGRDVLCEKPAVADPSEAQGLLAALARSGRTLGVNQNACFQPAFARLAGLVDAGAIGPVRHVAVTFRPALRQLASRQFDHWMFRRPLNLLLEQLVHPLSQVAWLLGAADCLDRVVAQPRLTTRDAGADVVTAFDACFAINGVPVSLHVGFGATFPTWRVAVFGDDGSIEADVLDDVTRHVGRGPWIEPLDRLIAQVRAATGPAAQALGSFARLGAQQLGLGRRADPFFRGVLGSIAHFRDALAGGHSPRTDACFGLALVAWCAQIAEALDLPAPRKASDTGRSSPGIRAVEEPVAGVLRAAVAVPLAASTQAMTSEAGSVASAAEPVAQGVELAATGVEVAATGVEMAAAGVERAATGVELAATGADLAASGVELAAMRAARASSGAGAKACAAGTATPDAGVGVEAQATRGSRFTPEVAGRPAHDMGAMLVVVFGAGGFIGQPTVEQLLQAGYRVRAVSRSIRPEIFPAHPRLSVMRADLRDADSVARAVVGASVVVNLAHGGGGNDFEAIRAAMVDGAVAVVRAAADIGATRLVHVGSIASLWLGEAGSVVTGETPCDPHPERRGDYARAKALADQAVREACEARCIAWTILRPGLVVGAGAPPLHSGLGDVPNPQHVVGWGRGRHGLPFVLVDDVAQAIVAAVRSPAAAGRHYNLVGDVRPSARDYLAELARATGRPLRFHPSSPWRHWAADWMKWVVKRAGGRRPPRPSLRDFRSRDLAARFDCSDAKRDLDWRPVLDARIFHRRAIEPHARSLLQA